MSQVKPFWERINLFFLFPFQMQPLLYALALSLSGLLVHVLFFVPMPFDYYLVEVGIALAASRYGFKVMQQGSQGQFDSSRFPNGIEADLVSMPWKLFAVSMILSFFEGVLTYLFPALDWLVSLLVSLAVPAAIATLLLTSSVWQSVTPFFWWPLIGAMGWSYLVLCFFLFLLSTGAGVAFPILIRVLGSSLVFPVLIFCVIYFGWVMCSLLGYVIFQNHTVLGYQPRNPLANEAGCKAPSADEQRKQRHLADDAYYAELFTQGDVQTAREMAYEAQRLEPDDLVLQKRYHQILLLDDNVDRLCDHAQAFISLLVRKKQFRDAIDAYQACRGKHPAFWPLAPMTLVEMGQYALRAHDPALCISLINGFDKEFKGDPSIPLVYELAARALVQSGASMDKVRKIAKVMQQRYPDHAATQEILWLVR